MEIDKTNAEVIKQVAGNTPHNPKVEPVVQKPAPTPNTSETAQNTPSQPAATPERTIADLEAKSKLVKEQIRRQELEAEIKADVEKLAQFQITDPKAVAERNAMESGDDD
jgi:hypothetical protein